LYQFIINVCEQVRARYEYVGEDTDELSLQPGDIVSVILYENPEEQVGDIFFAMHRVLCCLQVRDEKIF
jgi:hypothetical protein